jgi:hypothetical protein
LPTWGSGIGACLLLSVVPWYLNQLPLRWCALHIRWTPPTDGQSTTFFSSITRTTGAGISNLRDGNLRSNLSNENPNCLTILMWGKRWIFHLAEVRRTWDRVPLPKSVLGQVMLQARLVKTRIKGDTSPLKTSADIQVPARSIPLL